MSASVHTNASGRFVLCPPDLLDARGRQRDLDPRHTADEVLQRHAPVHARAEGAKLGRVARRQAEGRNRPP